jgi:predicted helicase
MRQSLMRSFDQIYLVDLHGSTKPKELAPDGVENENVFDIQKGVAIALFVKKNGAERGIWHTDIWGSRLAKYQECAGAEIAKIKWAEPKPISPYFMLSPLDWTGWDDYGQWWQVADSLNPATDKKQIFSINVLGFQSHRDHFAVALDRDEMARRVRDMRDASIPDEVLQERYSIKDNRDWQLKEAREAIQLLENPNLGIIDCAFRPFDNRPCFFGTEFMDYPRRELVDHVAGKDNLQLLVSRQIGTGTWRHGFIASQPAESCLISDGSTEQNYCFPLRLFEKSGKPVENLTSAFRAYLNTRYDDHYPPEEILGYIYAVLHAPIYRSRYAEFLRIDFPRIPFAEKSKDFEALSKLGWALVQAHLMRDLPRTKLADYHGKGTNEVEHIRWSAEDQRISINETQSFAPLPKAVWNFHIGGYQVIDKYLKSRKSRALSLDEINHVGHIADALAFTIDQMAQIDAAYAQAFPDRG